MKGSPEHRAIAILPVLLLFSLPAFVASEPGHHLLDSYKYVTAPGTRETYSLFERLQTQLFFCSVHS
jgi:hypothetical protein